MIHPNIDANGNRNQSVITGLNNIGRKKNKKEEDTYI